MVDDVQELKVPEGLCQCGCGGVTGKAKQNEPWNGYVKGQHKRFMPGHSMNQWAKWQLSVLQDGWKSKTHAELAAIVGKSSQAVRNKCYRLGLTEDRKWTAEELREIRAAYSSSEVAEEINLEGLAKRLGRHKTDVCGKASEMGLTDQRRKRINPGKLRALKRAPKFSSDEERRKAQGEISAKRLRERGHPRGFLGKKHSAETRLLIGGKSAARAALMSMEEKTAVALKAMKTKVAKGMGYTERPSASWKAAWREIGGKRNFYRSRWEANYARYLEWLRCQGEIESWEHEPKTFWFEKIKRGTVSYLPDFVVVEKSGREIYHEVKGWMDDRSKTKLARMARYYPEVKVIVVREKEYRAIERSVSALIADWERK